MATGSAPPCHHCGLPVVEPVEAEIGGTPRLFCCHGCSAVCAAIHGAGLQGFYDRAGEGAALAPPPPLAEDPAIYELPEVRDDCVRTLADGHHEARLLVEGIHCAACVWLIERHLGALPGVDAVLVNLAERQLTLRWDPATASLPLLLRALAAIGYAAVPFDAEAADGQLRREQRGRLYRLAFAGFAMMNLLWVSIALYSGADEGEFRDLLHWIGWLIATPTLLYSGQPFFRGSWGALRHGYLTMDVPIALGATITWGYSTWVTVRGAPTGEVYFDTVVNFLFVILVGRYLEARARQRAVSATHRLNELQPRVATLLEAGAERLVSVRAVTAGMQVLVRPGERLPVDGTVVDGSGAVDESMMTGETLPVAKAPGASVFAGTVNLDGALVLRVEQTLEQTALGRIIHLVEQAQGCRAPVQQLTDRIVPWFVLVTLSLALASFLFWLPDGLEPALLTAVAVLIVTCPCAFGLATPMAMAVAAGHGARHGILVKSGAALEALAEAGHVVFDKTGTLTEGRLRVVDSRWDGVEADEGLAMAAALERRSEHGVGAAIVAHAGARDWPDVARFRAHPGQGVSGEIAGRTWRVGSRGWFERDGLTPSPALQRLLDDHERHGRSGVLVAVDGRVAGMLVLADRVRDDARPMLDALRAAGVGITLLSGDRQATADAVAAELGGMQVVAEVLPEGKQAVIAGLQRGGARVAMVGDGVNDAPALAQADVGIALGSGTDVSIGSADVVLTRDRLLQLLDARRLAGGTLRTVRQNVALAFAYNLIMVPLAIAGLVTPLLAAVTMPLSSLAVIGNAARLGSLLGRTPRPATAPAVEARAWR